MNLDGAARRTAGARSRRAPGRCRAASGSARSAGAVALAAVRGAGGVAAAARRQPGRGARSATTWSCRSCRASTSRGRRWRTGGAGKLPTAPLERPLTAHRRAVREQLGRVDALRSELEAEGMATELLDGEQVVRLLWARFNPTKADRRPTRPAQRGGGAGRARRAGRARAALAGRRCGCGRRSPQSSLDFELATQHVAYVDRDVEQTIVVANTAGRTQHGLAARGDADPPAVHAVRVSCTRSSAAASASG